MNKYLAIYGKPRYLGILEYDGEIERGENVVAESVRGEDTAVIVGEINSEQEAQYRSLRNTVDRGDNAPKSTEPAVTDLTFISIATEQDAADANQYAEEEIQILKKAKEVLADYDLDIKLIDVELLRGKQKLFIYFSSEQRVDFRAYVRGLAREFKTRIELRQIGVRDEAKIIRGIGSCGRRCCCSYWLHQFEPIGIKMVKEQNLALNPAKISGICGRLMCCMCYEHNVYKEAWDGLPNPGSKIKTPNGNVILSGIDIASACVRCIVPGQGEIKVPTDKFEEFRATVTEGKEWDYKVPEKGKNKEEPEELNFVDMFSFGGKKDNTNKTHTDFARKSKSTANNKESEQQEGQKQKKNRRRCRNPWQNSDKNVEEENNTQKDRQPLTKQEHKHETTANAAENEASDKDEAAAKKHKRNRRRKKKTTTDEETPTNTNGGNG